MKKLLYTEIGPNGETYKKGDWREFASQTEAEVRGFFGEYRFLSNFWPAQVILDGVGYSSTELAYQAAKWQPTKRDFFLKCTELESIDYNRKNVPDKYSENEWNLVKTDIMRDLLRQKFDPKINPENYHLLITTGDKYLEERNWWGDLYWGADKDGNGENMLGKILMEIREELKKDQS